MSLVCNFLLGRTVLQQEKLLPDYVLLEVIHNHNYVFLEDASRIIISADIDTVSSYSVDSSQLFRICSADSVACTFCDQARRATSKNHSQYQEGSNMAVKRCMDCYSLMSERRYNTLKVIVTMYLLPLLSKDNEFIKQTIIGDRVGLTHNAMFCLAGYTYYNKHRNRLGLLSSDPCSAALDVYERPPSTNTLIKRIQTAIACRRKATILLSEDKLKTYRGYKASTRRSKQVALSPEEWKAWLHTMEEDETQPAGTDIIPQDEDNTITATSGQAPAAAVTNTTPQHQEDTASPAEKTLDGTNKTPDH